MFFLVLCLVPERKSGVIRHTRTSRLGRIVPNSAMGSIAFSLLFTVPASLFVVVGVRLFVNYGGGLLAVVPFAMGFAAAITYGINEPPSLAGCINVAVLSNVILGVALLAFAFEGVLGLLMAAPFAIPLACFGGAFRYLVQRRRWVQPNAPAILSAVLLFVPGVQSREYMATRRLRRPPSGFFARASRIRCGRKLLAMARAPNDVASSRPELSLNRLRFGTNPVA